MLVLLVILMFKMNPKHSEVLSSVPRYKKAMKYLSEKNTCIRQASFKYEDSTAGHEQCG